MNYREYLHRLPTLPDEVLDNLDRPENRAKLNSLLWEVLELRAEYEMLTGIRKQPRPTKLTVRECERAYRRAMAAARLRGKENAQAKRGGRRAARRITGGSLPKNCCPGKNQGGSPLKNCCPQ